LLHAGVPATFVGYARARAEGPGSEDFLDDQLRALKFEPTETYVFGLARLDGIQIVVLAVRDVVVDAMPKVVAPGAKVVLQGRIEGAFEDLRLLVDDGPSKVRTTDFVPTSDGRFKLELEAPSTEGRHLFEWTGEDPRGWRATLLTIPIYVGSTAPDTFGGALASEKPNPLDLKAWEKATTDRVNALRTAEGLEPVTANAALSMLAAQQASKYAENPLAVPNVMFDQLNASGLRTRDAFQYRGVTYNLYSRLDRALARPSVREQVLKPNFTRMAVAFKAQPKGGYADTWMLSEALGAFDSQALSAQLLKEVNRRRVSKALPALYENTQLAAMAQTFADKTCAGATDAGSTLETEARKLKGVVVRGYQVYTASVLVPALMRTDKSNNPQTPIRTTLTHAGVGACEKGKPGTDANELAVFLLAEAAPK